MNFEEFKKKEEIFKEKLKEERRTPNSVSSDILLAIDYEYKGKDITIEIIQPEFTSLCPMTGLPDFATIKIYYIPNEKIVELKSLKYYFLQYRNVGIFYESLVNKVLYDLVEVLKPKYMEVIAEFTPRGGIKTIVKANYKKEV
ncbi:MAG: preQ(1) synthase [candidate division WOR-3 bacterium]|nr:preQ(1) synthase [candidate division WOR-3 bacterium]MCX7947510.1 preQ(1) synthase [candidate division WOR-3 bacterium]MDW8150396.1 preQ(1) synthase [candidate division WOR-3 bacterium]